MENELKQWQTLFFWAPKWLQMVTAAMKLKDTYSLEECYDQPRQHIQKQRHYFADIILPTKVHLVKAFLPKNKHLLIWWQSLSAVIMEPKKIKFVTVSIVSPSICHEVMGPNAMILVFWMLSFKPTFSLSSFTVTKRLLVLRFLL